LSSVPYGVQASRETIARVLTMLRLTRWLSLVSRGRDQVSGRLQGSLYVLHDEPLTPAEAMELDQDYLELVGHCLSHNTKAVRIVAQHVLEEIRRDTRIDLGQLPTRFESWEDH
ncbi:STY4528 family pathogenicity island replication protein, partial [Pseudomonas sp. D5002]|uniref:STY4528 family pathogenicity island replication protein n=1 Tax=Pseudomonas sp. D5002 TaxID=2738818 RepID=UPI00210922FA